MNIIQKEYKKFKYRRTKFSSKFMLRFNIFTLSFHTLSLILAAFSPLLKIRFPFWLTLSLFVFQLFVFYYIVKEQNNRKEEMKKMKNAPQNYFSELSDESIRYDMSFELYCEMKLYLAYPLKKFTPNWEKI